MRFNTGDEVVLYKIGVYTYGASNPEWGRDGKYVSGVVMEIDSDGEMDIKWKNGASNSYEEHNCELRLLSEVKKPKKNGAAIDFSHMDKVVMAPDTRDEITAVLRQHQTGDIIFEKWGLGDVIEYGKGMTFLFYGPPGTGKTWAANCMAKALGMEMLSIGAAEIQSSEPGGANRAIDSAFVAAASEGKVLFIDECDGLISSRQNVGMILGSEINSLLTNIEKFEGVVILATNMIENLDAALERRISLIVEFPAPDYEARLAIWKKMLPEKMPLELDVIVEKLAEHALTGGQIKNAVLAAARMAISSIPNIKDFEDVKVSLAHFESAIKRITSSKNLMGTASRYHAMPTRSDKVQSTRVEKSMESSA